jgi:hypothetical protein
VTIAYSIGLVLALGLSVLATAVGLDRDRAYYPVVMVVIASYYVLFAVMGGSTRILVLESAVMGAFACVALLGFRFNLWLVVVALATHGIFDLFHARLIASSAVPGWWPAFCLSFDVGAAGYLAWLLRRVRKARA